MSKAPDKIYYGVLDNGFQCVNTVQTSTTPDAYIRKDALLKWAKGKKEEYEKETSKEYDGCIWVLNLLIEKLESL